MSPPLNKRTCARVSRARRMGLRSERGFTLLELVMVLTIVGILASIAIPGWFHLATARAREAALKQTLYVFRDVIDQFHADQGRYPNDLSELVEKEYMRAPIPPDPFTRSSDTWILIPHTTEAGIFDVRSGSDLIGGNDVPYNEW